MEWSTSEEEEDSPHSPESPLPPIPLIDLCDGDSMNDGVGYEVFEVEQFEEPFPFQPPPEQIIVHALLEDKTLKVLFQHVKTNDLLACRRVCRKWYEMSIAFVHAKIEIPLFGTTLQERPGQKLIRSVGNFFDLMNLNILILGFGIPFGKYRIRPFDTSEPDGPGQLFLQLCGNSAKEFDLRTPFQSHLVENVGEMLKHATNLEHFTMAIDMSSTNRNIVRLFSKIPKLPLLKTFTSVNENPVGRRTICPTFLYEFFTAAQNVSTLQLTDSMNQIVVVSLEVLHVLEAVGSGALIENLTLSVRTITEEHLDVLRRMALRRERLKLKKLKILRKGVTRAQSEDLIWLKIVTLFSQSLVSLYVNKISTKMIEFSPMPDLKFLILHISENTHFKIKNCSEIFPQLDFLRLLCPIEVGAHQWDEFIDGGTEDEVVWCPRMDGLSLQSILVRIQSFDRTITVFPMLIILDMDLILDGDKILRRIWTHLTMLKKLNLRGTLPHGTCIDSIFTGIPLDKVNRLDNLRESSEVLKSLSVEMRGNEILMLADSLRMFPSILDLPNLAYLGLNLTEDGGFGEGCYRLSDVTAYMAIYSMKQLRCVCIYQCEFSRICSQILVSDLVDLKTWCFRDEGDLDIIPPKL